MPYRDFGPYTDVLDATHNCQKAVVKVFRIGKLSPHHRHVLTKRLENALTEWKRHHMHPNIARVTGMVLGFGDLPGIEMPLYSNGNAYRYLKAHPNVDKYRLICGIAEGLNHLHSQQPPIIHGMVCATNILISDSGAPLLTDIGLGTIPLEAVGVSPFQGDKYSRHLQKVRWLAPEIIDPENVGPPDISTSLNDCTPSTDVYSFGMTILELFTEKVPYHHVRSTPAVINEINNRRHPGRLYCTEVPDELWCILESCWSHHAKERPTTAVLRSRIGALGIHGSGRRA
ncbi:TKL/TKL-ccin protein kinase [Coprinopsis cinerea AmutBmut pab1-1]|nr:TKL/TKL-ccin protein kinase [Coprinopsis cinerea AmutBmut pab1-1]